MTEMPGRRITPGKLVRRFLKADGGVAAVEFALIATPFFMLLFAIIEVSMIIFSSLILENGVIESARTIRTGEFQSTGGGPDEFRALVCDSMVAMIDCGPDLYIDVQVFSSFGATSFSDPMETGTFGEEFGYQPAAANQIVLMRVYYLKKVHTPFLRAFFANSGTDKRVISWTAAFETEPF